MLPGLTDQSIVLSMINDGVDSNRRQVIGHWPNIIGHKFLNTKGENINAEIKLYF